jgi:hypothetical protein
MAATTSPRTRFWLETVLATTSGALGLLTILWHDWLEAFGWDPDNGNGVVEWLIAVGLIAIALASALAARQEHLTQRRAA